MQQIGFIPQPEQHTLTLLSLLPFKEEHEGIVKSIATGTITAIIMITTIAILICIWKSCRYGYLLMQSSLLLYPLLRWLCITPQTNTFIEVDNLWVFKTVWAHFASVVIYPTRQRCTGFLYIQIIPLAGCSRYLQIDWSSIMLTHDREHVIKLPLKWQETVWTNNDLKHIDPREPYQIQILSRVLESSYGSTAKCRPTY